MRGLLSGALFCGAAVATAGAATSDRPIGAIALAALSFVLGALALALPRPRPPRGLEDATQAIVLLEAAGTKVYQGHAGLLAPALAAQEEHDRLLDALAHELRTPLNSIRGFSDVLLEEIDGPLRPDVREELTVVRDAGVQLHALLDEVLQVASGRGSEPALLARVDVAQLARDVLKMHAPRAKEKGLELRAALPDSGPRPRTDERRVRQILGNLVGNAVKYTTRGHVEVSLASAPGEVRVTVADTGPGIAPSDRESIFTAWERAGERGPDGHGLGLAIARELAGVLGGRIELESTVGEGSRFTLVLPAEGP